ncbi:MAG: hypothetical protein HOW73_51220 [Polyangiaceae bacterium]|nr:hypothetical protein [Polyangiaceae bacterium]
MNRSTTNRIATLAPNGRRLATATFLFVAPITLLACPKEEEQPPPVQPAPVQPTTPPPQTGLTPDMQAKVSRACERMSQCKAAGQPGAEYNSCMRDLGQPESYTGQCGAQQTALIECINNLQSCDQGACATQSAAVTACGVMPAGLLKGFLGQ